MNAPISQLDKIQFHKRRKKRNRRKNQHSKKKELMIKIPKITDQETMDEDW